MATAIVDDLPYKSGDEVLAFVNGMGGTPLIELYIVYNELNNFLKARGIKIGRNLIGSLHHVARNGRLLYHPAQAGRPTQSIVGCARQDAGDALGSLTLTNDE